jgi:hypothetical protein
MVSSLHFIDFISWGVLDNGHYTVLHFGHHRSTGCPNKNKKNFCHAMCCWKSHTFSSISSYVLIIFWIFLKDSLVACSKSTCYQSCEYVGKVNMDFHLK